MGIFVKFWHLFTMPAHQIWSYHVTQEENFEIFLFFPNFIFNIRKSHKMFSGKALYFRSYQPETSQGGGNTPPPPPVPLGLSFKFSVAEVYRLIHRHPSSEKLILAQTRIWQKSKNTIVGPTAFRAYRHTEIVN